MDVNDIHPSPLLEDEYLTIEAALIGTEKGRSFLGEYLKRNRSIETHRILRSISKLHYAATAPAFDEAAARDIKAALTKLSRVREDYSPAVDDKAIRFPNLDLCGSLEHIEALLLVLLEHIEEAHRGHYAHANGERPLGSSKLFSELSAVFSAD